MSTPEKALIRDKAERMSDEQLAAEINRCEGGFKVAANSAAARRFLDRRQIMLEEQQRRAKERPVRSHSLNVHLVNLTEVEKDLVATLVAVLTDPHMEVERQLLGTGQRALVVEGEEVTWIDPTEAERCAV